MRNFITSNNFITDSYIRYCIYSRRFSILFVSQISNNFVYSLKDFIFDLKVVGESFETSVPWDKCEKLCSNVKAVVRNECEKSDIKYFWISCRVTQTYDAGACVYFYFGFKHSSYEKAMHIYEEIETRARDEILASGRNLWF